MKKRIFSVMLVLGMIVTSMVGMKLPTKAATSTVYIPLSVYGFTADVVANNLTKNNKGELATSTYFDGPNYSGGHWSLYDSGVQAAGALPTGGLIKTTTGKKFQLASYKAKNSLQLSSTNTVGRLSLTKPACYSNVAILCSGGNGNSTFTAKVTYTDGTKDSSAATCTAYDWYTSNNAKVTTTLGRVKTATDTTGRLTSAGTIDPSGPGLYEYYVPISHKNKKIATITFTGVNIGTNQTANIMAVSAAIPSDEAAKLGTGGDGTTTVSSTVLAKNTLTMDSQFKVTQTGKKISVSWSKVSGATGYDVYAQYCGSKFSAKSINQVKKGTVTKLTIKKVNGKKLNLTKNYKVYVVAYKYVGTSKVVLGTTLEAHIVGCKNKKYSNVKKVTVKKTSVSLAKGKTSQIKAKNTLVYKKKKQLNNNHASEFRYATTNAAVATVTSKGKITAVGTGSCVVYVYARNGFAKSVKVKVK